MIDGNWIGFAGSVIGGLIGGLFTFLGVKLSLKHEKEKERKEALEKANETKPRLEIIKYRGFDETADDKTINSDCNVLALKIKGYRDDNGQARFDYDPAAMQNENLVFVEYLLQNTGKTEISEVVVTCNMPKIMAVFEYEKSKENIQENYLNYYVDVNKRFIKPGDTIKVRIYYIRDQVFYPSPFGGTIFSIWLFDINNRIWMQSLNSPQNEIEVPQLSSLQTFKKHTDFSAAIACFKDPRLW